jgi:hypothetical protein
MNDMVRYPYARELLFEFYEELEPISAREAPLLTKSLCYTSIDARDYPL